MENNITWLGETNFRNERRKFGIKEDDRRRHIYIIGKTGVGKSTLLENMIIEDIRAGRGVAFLDPHGESAEKILDYIPEERVEDVIYLDPSDSRFPIAFNPLEQVDPEFRHLVASGMMGVLQKIWADAWSARMAYIMNNTLLALLEYPGTTLLGIMRMLNDAVYRKEVVDNLKDPVVKGFWTNEFARYSQKFETEATAAIQNKVGQFVSNPLVRNILGQAHSSIDLRKIMDEGKILIVNLSKGRIGEDNSALLGAMIITKLQLAAMSRVDTPEKDRRDFYLCVDEFQNFATESFANILSEARKYRLSLTVANQYLRQLDQEGKSTVKDAIFGNVGTMVIFRVGAEDGEFIEKEFMPEFLAGDMVSLAKYTVYIKLMIDGIASRPFSANTLPPPPKPARSYKPEIIEIARTRYALPREKVEGKIAEEWMNQGGGGGPAVKIERRDERRLASVLTDGAQVIKKRPPAAGTGGGGDFRKKPAAASPAPEHAPQQAPAQTEQRPERHEERRAEPQRPPETPRERKPIDLSALKEALEKAKANKKEGE